jgi:hypothetical protein
MCSPLTLPPSERSFKKMNPNAIPKRIALEASFQAREEEMLV